MRLPKLFTDSFYVVSANGINYLTRAAWGILIARWLGPEYLGIYFYYLGIFSILSIIGQFGKEKKLIRELGVGSEPEKTFVFYIHKQVIITVILISLSTAYLLLTENNLYFLFIGICALLISYMDKIYRLLSGWFLFCGKARFISNLTIVRSSLMILFGTLLYYIGVPVFILLSVPVILSIFRGAYLLLMLRTKYGFSPVSFLKQTLRWNDFRLLYKETWIFGLLVILQTINSQLNPVILKILGFTPYDFGIVAAASRMKSIVALAGGAIYNVIFPRLARDFGTSLDKFSDTFYRVFYPILFMNLLLCTFLILFSEPLIVLLFGEQFRESVPFMVMFSVGSISTLLMLLNSTVIAADKMKALLTLMIVLTLIQQIMKFTLIPVFGKIAIGYVEAVMPYFSFAGFLLILRKALKPQLKFSLVYKLVILLPLSIILPLVMILLNANIYLTFIFISIALFIISHYMGLLKDLKSVLIPVKK